MRKNYLKAISAFLCLIFLLNFVACTSATTDVPKEITLTKQNLLDYINFDGVFVDGECEPLFKIGSVTIYYSSAVLDFQVYPVAGGTFENLEITLMVTSDASAFTREAYRIGEYWHLTNCSEEDREHIKISFRVGADGRFSKEYSVECNGNAGVLKGECKFEIVSVKGTFIKN